MADDKLMIAEINVWVWLNELENQIGKPVSLETIPPSKWDELEDLGFNAVWLMGVWKRSPLGRKISQENTSLYDDYGRSLPDWQMDDLPGSPYCIREYSVDRRLGGNKALAVARQEVAGRGMKLFLDYVPNHIALDHKWIDQNPEFLIRGDEVDLLRNQQDYFKVKNGIFANARDPFFPPWRDVAQLNAFSDKYRIAAAEVLDHIGSMCDGVRCDMAMLMLNRVFSYTWQSRAGAVPPSEFWTEIIPAVRKKYPDFIFLAEAYWGLEWDLLQLGFDYCYDKRLYDRLTEENAETVRQHLMADRYFQSHLVRFIENHDEERISKKLPIPRVKAGSVLVASLPGATLLYEGEWDGRQCRNHVLLGRRQPEVRNEELFSFFQVLLPAVKKIPRDAEWKICDVTGWDDNQSCKNLIAYTWMLKSENILVIVNYADHPAQGKVNIPWDEMTEPSVEFRDIFCKEAITRETADLKRQGLFVDLPAWGFHYFSVMGQH